MSALRSRLAVAAAGILLAVGALSGCASTPPDLHAATAAKLQLGVLDVTNSAKAGEYADAQAKLAALQADLLAAAATQRVSAARVAVIQEAINAVGGDLADALKSQADRATPTPQPTSGDAPGTSDGQNGGDTATPSVPAPAPAPAPEPSATTPADPPKGGDDGKGKDDPCKGKDKKNC